MKKVLLTLLVITLLIMLCGCSAGSTTSNDKQRNIDAVNIALDGEVAYHNGYVYYIYDEDQVWKSDLKSDIANRVFSHEWIKKICVQQDAIYFATSEYVTGIGSRYAIYAYNFETQQKVKLVDVDKLVGLLAYNDNCLYYTVDDTMYEYDLSTKQTIAFVDAPIHTFTCSASGIYYVTKDNNGGTLYRMENRTSEPAQICVLPKTDFYEHEVDLLYVIDNTVYVRKRHNIDGDTCYSSRMYQFKLPNQNEAINFEYVEDVHAIIPAPDGKGHYYLLAIQSESAKDNFIRYFSHINPNSAYLASYHAARLAYCVNESDLIKEVDSSYIYYSGFYLAEDSIILKPSYGNEYFLFSK